MAITKFRGKYHFLSNMYPVGVTLDNGEFYPSAEHAFQAMKTLDDKERIAVSLCRSPEEAREAGRQLELRPDWEFIKNDVMYNILRSKFDDAELAQMLKDTGSEELVEGNTWGDTYWGVCNGSGQNVLGNILMRIRKEIA